MRSAVLAVLALALPSCGPGAAPPSAPPTAPPTRPHVVLISIDTLRADRLGVYGAERALTPQLDAFAQHAWLFERVHSNCNSTGPSHMTMLTGVLPPVHGVRHNAGVAASPALPMLAERLRRGLRDGGEPTAATCCRVRLRPRLRPPEAHLQSIENKLSDVGRGWRAPDRRPSSSCTLRCMRLTCRRRRQRVHGQVLFRAAGRRVPKLRALRDQVNTAGAEDLGFLSRPSGRAARTSTSPTGAEACTTAASTRWTPESAGCWASCSARAGSTSPGSSSRPTTARPSSSTAPGSTASSSRKSAPLLIRPPGGR